MYIYFVPYKSVSLATRSNTYFMRNPPLQEGKSLKDWYYRNERDIQTLLTEGSHKNSYILLPPPAENEIITIATIEQSSKKDKVGWIHGTLSLNPSHPKLAYTACQYCFRPLNGEEGWCLPCTSCGKKTLLEARCHVEVYIDDGTGSIETKLFTPTAEKVTTFSASQLHNAYEQGTPVGYEVDEILRQEPLYCFIKHTEKTYRGNQEESYEIVSVYNEAEVQAHRNRHVASSSKAADTHTNASELVVGTLTRADAPASLHSITESSLPDPPPTTPASVIGSETMAAPVSKAESAIPAKESANQSLSLTATRPEPSITNAKGIYSINCKIWK